MHKRMLEQIEEEEEENEKLLHLKKCADDLFKNSIISKDQRKECYKCIFSLTSFFPKNEDDFGRPFIYLSEPFDAYQAGTIIEENFLLLHRERAKKLLEKLG